MVQWLQINSNNNYCNNPMMSFYRQQGYLPNTFTPMFNFSTPTFVPPTQNFVNFNYGFVPPQNAFWGSKFGNFLAKMFGRNIQQPVMNNYQMYQDMGLSLNNTPKIRNSQQVTDNGKVERASKSELTQSRVDLSNMTIEQRAQEHRKVVEQSVDYIEKYFDESGLANHFKTESDKQLFLQCLKEVVYDKEKTGAGHAEAGIIHIETNNEKCNTLAEMTKLLIHEANHAYSERKSAQDGTLNFPTKAEEIESEMLALKTMSYFVKNVDGMQDYEIYGKNISEFTNENVINNDEGFKNWLNGYQQLADNLSGDVTIQHSLNPDKHSPQGQIKIQSGDIISIDGEPPRIIGKDAYLEGCDDTAIAQLIMHKRYYNTPENERMPDTFGNLVFDDLAASPDEIKHVFKDNNNFEKIPFTVSRQNPQTGNLEVVYTGYKYIPVN